MHPPTQASIQCTTAHYVRMHKYVSMLHTNTCTYNSKLSEEILVPRIILHLEHCRESKRTTWHKPPRMHTQSQPSPPTFLLCTVKTCKGGKVIERALNKGTVRAVSGGMSSLPLAVSGGGGGGPSLSVSGGGGGPSAPGGGGGTPSRFASGARCEGWFDSESGIPAAASFGGAV